MTLQFGASLTYDSRVIIYDHNMFLIQATENTWDRETLLQGRLSSSDLLIKVACFVKEMNKIINKKVTGLN